MVGAENPWPRPITSEILLPQKASSYQSKLRDPGYLAFGFFKIDTQGLHILDLAAVLVEVLAERDKLHLFTIGGKGKDRGPGKSALEGQGLEEIELRIRHIIIGPAEPPHNEAYP